MTGNHRQIENDPPTGAHQQVRIQFCCPTCGVMVVAPVDLVGTKTTCGCGQRLLITQPIKPSLNKFVIPCLAVRVKSQQMPLFPHPGPVRCPTLTFDPAHQASTSGETAIRARILPGAAAFEEGPSMASVVFALCLVLFIFWGALFFVFEHIE